MEIDKSGKKYRIDHYQLIPGKLDSPAKSELPQLRQLEKDVTPIKLRSLRD
jgi:hypothetical protein